MSEPRDDDDEHVEMIMAGIDELCGGSSYGAVISALSMMLQRVLGSLPPDDRAMMTVEVIRCVTDYEDIIPDEVDDEIGETVGRA